MQYGFYFNAARCTGCRSCVLACKDYHNLSDGVAFRQVYELVGGGWTQVDGGSWVQDCLLFHVSVACNHCNSPACTAVCPTGAMHKDEGTGFVLVDTMRCIGCGYCAFSCPYHVPSVDEALGHSVKCDGCHDRVDAGKAPVCVEACPLRALDFGPVEDLFERYGTIADLPPLPSSTVTIPNLVVRPPRCLEERGIHPDDVPWRVMNVREIAR